MSEKIVGVGEEETQSYVTLLPCSTSLKSICHMGSQLKEINYMGLSDCSSVDSSTGLNASEENSIACTLNLKATELTLGLPGLPDSPKRGTDLCPLSSTKLDEKLLFPLHPSEDGSFPVLPKTVVAGNKRGFSDAMDGSSEGKFLNSCPVKETSSSQPLKMEEALAQNIAQESSLAPKAQVVGWPPIKSLRKSTLASTSKTNEEVDGKPGSTVLLIKVSMDGAPYLRKVDLRNYFAYQELSSALENMFSCFTIGECGSHGAPGKESLSESKLKDLFRGSEYVLTYEDKDGDWMLVGDVPWELFINTCKRLRIMKSSDAIGLAPRAMEKCRARN